MQCMHANQCLRVATLYIGDVSPDVLEAVQLVERADKVAASSRVPGPACGLWEASLLRP